MADKKDPHWKPDPLPPRPLRVPPPPFADRAEAEAAFAAVGVALRALAELWDAGDEGERVVAVDELEPAYRELFRALEEVRRAPLTPSESLEWSDLQDTIMAHLGGTRLREAARAWGEIGRTVVARLPSSAAGGGAGT